MEIHNLLDQAFKKNDFITLHEAQELNISPMQLTRLVADEKLFRVERAVYAQNIDWLTDPLKKYAPVCTLIPEAIISGISALTYYNLTDQEEQQTGLTVPFYQKLKNPRFSVTRARGLNYRGGIKKKFFGKQEVRIYDMEKSVVDAFKYQTEEVAFKALKGYLKHEDKDVSKLCDYARKMRKPLNVIVTALLAD